MSFSCTSITNKPVSAEDICMGCMAAILKDGGRSLRMLCAGRG
jgi:hypothetical protein